MAGSEVAKDSNGEIEVEITGDGDHLGAVLRDFLAGLASDGKTPLFHRIRVSLFSNAPRLIDASRNSAQALVKWTRQGSALRALLVFSVGTITLLALAGLLVFTLFFLAATFNAGGFLVLFFVFTTAIYIGALSVAAFLISSIVTLTILGVIIATGWVGFIWFALTAAKSLDVNRTIENRTVENLKSGKSEISAKYKAFNQIHMFSNFNVFCFPVSRFANHNLSPNSAN